MGDPIQVGQERELAPVCAGALSSFGLLFGVDCRRLRALVAERRQRPRLAEHPTECLNDARSVFRFGSAERVDEDHDSRERGDRRRSSRNDCDPFHPDTSSSL